MPSSAWKKKNTDNNTVGMGDAGIKSAIQGSNVFFFFNDTATTEIYTTHNTLSLHDALPISVSGGKNNDKDQFHGWHD